MKPSGALKLLSEVRDLQIFDVDGFRCGIVDDIEFDGGAGKDLVVRALLVGPGAYSGRMPRWASALVRMVAGKRIARVSWSDIDTITSAVTLKIRAIEAGLGVVERRVAARIPKAGAL